MGDELQRIIDLRTSKFILPINSIHQRYENMRWKMKLFCIVFMPGFYNKNQLLEVKLTKQVTDYLTSLNFMLIAHLAQQLIQLKLISCNSQKSKDSNSPSGRCILRVAKDLCYKQCAYSESLKWVEKILEIEKLNEGALILKGQLALNNQAECLFSLYRFEEAVKLADLVLNINPQQQDTLQIKVLALWYLKKHEEIMKIADRILQFDPIPIGILERIVCALFTDQTMQAYKYTFAISRKCPSVYDTMLRKSALYQGIKGAIYQIDQQKGDESFKQLKIKILSKLEV